MTDSSPPVIFLSGAGGGTVDLEVFRDGAGDTTRFEVIGYPGWRRYVADGFSAEALIAELAAEVTAKIPRGPIRIVGVSIGGHFGYAIGLHLQATGREIAGLCAIDSFMIASSAPSAGWKGRALEQGFELLRERRFGDFFAFYDRSSGVRWLALPADGCRVWYRNFLRLQAAYHRFQPLIRCLKKS